MGVTKPHVDGYATFHRNVYTITQSFGNLIPILRFLEIFMSISFVTTKYYSFILTSSKSRGHVHIAALLLIVFGFECTSLVAWACEVLGHGGHVPKDQEQRWWRSKVGQVKLVARSLSLKSKPLIAHICDGPLLSKVHLCRPIHRLMYWSISLHH